MPYLRRSVRILDRFAHNVLATDVVAPSPAMAAELRAAGVSDARLHTIPHGIQQDTWRAALRERRKVRDELGVGEKIVLMTIGRITDLKNQLSLVHSFARVRQDEPQSFLIVVGAGNTDQLNLEIARMGIADSVLVTGFRPDVPRLLAAADVYVHPAHTESFGLTLLEAATMGIPIVSTPVGIAPTLIGSKFAGILTDSASVDAIAAGIRDMLIRRDKWPAMSSLIADRAKAFTAQRMVGAYEHLYTRALQAPRCQ